MWPQLHFQLAQQADTEIDLFGEAALLTESLVASLEPRYMKLLRVVLTEAGGLEALLMMRSSTGKLISDGTHTARCSTAVFRVLARSYLLLV